MIDISKENLLKILVNDKQETPKENTSEFYEYTINKNSDYYDSTGDQVQYNGYTAYLSGSIGTSGGYVTLVDPNGNLLMRKKPISNGITYNVIAIDIDETGRMYGLMDYSNKTYLAYFNNIFVQTADNTYDIIVEKSYDLSSMFSEILNVIGENGTYYNSDIKKSPTNSQFLINWAYGKTESQYTLISILYTVNVGSANTFKYLYSNIGNYTYNWIKNVKPNWTENSVNFTALILSTNAITSTWDTSTQNVEFYKVVGNFESNAMSNTLILNQNNYFITDYRADSGNSFSKNAVQKNNSIYFISNEVIGENITTTIYKYDTSLKIVWRKTGIYATNSNNWYRESKGNIRLVNNQIFAWVLMGDRIEENTIYKTLYAMHIVENNYNEQKVLENITGALGVTGLIQNAFNLYELLFIGTPSYIYHLTYIYKSTGYNGEEFFGDGSVTSETMTLYNVNNRPIFNRNLYNKTIVGNSINSTTQVPFNYLNNEVIIKQELNSFNNNIINSDNEEIAKNQYEELYINNIDSYKVYDNNNGSVYNQACSLRLTQNIFNGFEDDYKIKKYRINYSDGTHEDKNIISHSTNGNEAEINLFIYPIKEISNIQLYDSNFSVAFITIAPVLELNKLYKITQKIRVE